MSGERQWTIRGTWFAPIEMVVQNGPVLTRGEQVVVVPRERLSAVEAERDALRTERDAYREGLAHISRNPDRRSIVWLALFAAAVLARFPKNETEQG